MPPWCAALTGLNFQLLPVCMFRGAADRVPFEIHSRSSFSAPTKIAQSVQIMLHVPRRATIHSSSIMQEPSIAGTISTCTARVVKQVKRNPHFVSVFRRTVTQNWSAIKK